MEHRFYLIDEFGREIASGEKQADLEDVAFQLAKLNGENYRITQFVRLVEAEFCQCPEDPRSSQEILLAGDEFDPIVLMRKIKKEFSDNATKLMEQHRGDLQSTGQAMSSLIGPYAGMIEGLLEICSASDLPVTGAFLKAVEIQYENTKSALGDRYCGDLDKVIGKWMVTRDPVLVAWLVSEARSSEWNMRRGTAGRAISSLSEQSKLFGEHANLAGWSDSDALRCRKSFMEAVSQSVPPGRMS